MKYVKKSYKGELRKDVLIEKWEEDIKKGIEGKGEVWSVKDEVVMGNVERILGVR